MERTDRDIADYLARLPDDVRGDMETLHELMADVMTGEPVALYVGKFWGGSDQEIIGYGEQNYQRSDKTKVEWFDIGIAVQRNYLSVYLNAVEDGKYVSEKYGRDLGKVKVGKASLGFASVDDIDLARLRTMAERTRQLTSDE